MGKFKDEFGFAGEKSANNTWVDEKVGYDREDYYYKITHESNKYNDKMAEMSLCFSMAAFNSYKVENKNYKIANQNISDMFTDRQGHSFSYFNDDYTEKPSEDSVGVGICVKELSESEALAIVVIRGGGYEDEWLSNMTIGSTGDHEGFSKASDKVVMFIKDVFCRNEIQKYTKMKLWMTGYSRGSAIANITAARLNCYADKEQLGFYLREHPSLLIPKNNFYVYCFEPPFTTCEKEDKAKNDNIFNIVNPMDLVTQMPPRTWGFRRYGIKKCIPIPKDSTIDTFKDMCNTYLKYVGTDAPTVGANSFISAVNNNQVFSGYPLIIDIVSNLLIAGGIKTRLDYVNGYQEMLKDLYNKVMHKLDLALNDIKNEFYKHMYIYISGILLSISEDLRSEKNEHVTGKVLYRILQLIYEDIKNKKLNDQELEKEIILLSDLPINVIREEKDKMKKVEIATGLTAMVTNIGGFLMGHYPELCMGWIRYLKDHGSKWEEISAESLECPEEMKRFMKLFEAQLL